MTRAGLCGLVTLALAAPAQAAGDRAGEAGGPLGLRAGTVVEEGRALGVTGFTGGA